MDSSKSKMDSPVFILVHKPETSSPDEEHFEKNFRKKSVEILSFIQIVSSVVAVVLQVTVNTICSSSILPNFLQFRIFV